MTKISLLGLFDVFSRRFIDQSFEKPQMSFSEKKVPLTSLVSSERAERRVIARLHFSSMINNARSCDGSVETEVAVKKCATRAKPDNRAGSRCATERIVRVGRLTALRLG